MNDANLWDAFRNADDEGARQELLNHHLPLVRYVAREIWNRIHGKLDRDDLVSAGTLGLMDALASFEPERGLAFSTFATPRIRGAILDHIRQWDHVPRSLRRKQRAIDEARDTLSARLARPPSRTEVAEFLDLDVETLARWESDASDAVSIALDAPLAGEGKQITAAEIVPGQGAEEIQGVLIREDETSAVREALARLPERDRLVMTLYYYEELKMHQIADILGVTESRISQIRSKVLKTLRSEVAHLREVPV